MGNVLTGETNYCIIFLSCVSINKTKFWQDKPQFTIYAHTQKHTRTHTRTHSLTRTHTQSHLLTHTYTRTHTYSHTHTRTHTHTNTYSHTHTRTHTHTHTHSKLVRRSFIPILTERSCSRMLSISLFKTIATNFNAFE